MDGWGAPPFFTHAPCGSVGQQTDFFLLLLLLLLLLHTTNLFLLGTENVGGGGGCGSYPPKLCLKKLQTVSNSQEESVVKGPLLKKSNLKCLVPIKFEESELKC